MVVLALVTSLILQQPPATGRDCLDDNHTDRCDAADRAQVLARFRAPTIEDDAEAGAEVYRALYVDGYGEPLPVIAFERRPARPPEVVFYNGETRLSALLSDVMWRRVQTEARFADQVVTVPRPEIAPNTIPPMCLHSWVTTVEMANSPLNRTERVPVRRRTEDACTNGLTTQVAFRLMELAVESMLRCSGLDKDVFGAGTQLLVACTTLEGDTLAAAEVKNALELRQRANVDAKFYWSRYVGTNAVTTLDWNGEKVDAPLHGKQVSDFLAARQAETGLKFTAREVRGVDARRVTVSGSAERSWVPWSGRTPGHYSEQAAYRQDWVWDPAGQGWTLRSMTVGAFVSVD